MLIELRCRAMHWIAIAANRLRSTIRHSSLYAKNRRIIDCNSIAEVRRWRRWAASIYAAFRRIPACITIALRSLSRRISTNARPLCVSFRAAQRCVNQYTSCICCTSTNISCIAVATRLQRPIAVITKAAFLRRFSSRMAVIFLRLV